MDVSFRILVFDVTRKKCLIQQRVKSLRLCNPTLGNRLIQFGQMTAIEIADQVGRGKFKRSPRSSA
jgi:hypothetical protein